MATAPAESLAAGKESLPGAVDDSTRLIDPALCRPWAWLDHNAGGRDEVREESVGILEDLASAEQRVRSDYIGRYPIELLQNAHDACDDAGVTGTVWIDVTPTALLVGNEGAPFDHNRVRALTRLGSGTKTGNRERRHVIGYKGIGFSSVFAISDCPQILRTGGQDFCFDQARARLEVGSKMAMPPTSVPARKFPFALDVRAWADDAEAVKDMFDGGAVTVVRLPYRRGTSAEAVEQDISDVLRPQLLLFLPRVSKVCLRMTTCDQSWERFDGGAVGAGRVVTITVSGEPDTQWLVKEGRVRAPADSVGQLGDPLWANVRRLYAGVALPWRDGAVPVGAPAQALHVYFPTDDRSGRAALVHGDFYVDSARRHIEATGPGGRISDAVATAAADLLVRLAVSVSCANSGLLDCLAKSSAASGYGSHVDELVAQRLRDARLIPAAAGGRLRTPSQAKALAVGAEANALAAMTPLLHPRADLIAQEAVVGHAGALLEELSIAVLQATEVAKRLEPAQCGLRYEVALELIHRWAISLPTWGAVDVHRQLRGKRILQDREGEWRMPKELASPGSELPILPAVLRRAIVAIPATASADLKAWIVKQLRVPTLTAATIVDDLLAAIAENRYAQRPAQARGALRLLRKLWDTDRAVLTERRQKLQQVPVPTRSESGHLEGWLPAGKVYFPHLWSESRIAEDLYGNLGNPDFLAIPTPRSKRQLAHEREFYRTLGITDSPRTIAYTIEARRDSYATTGLPQFENWRDDSRVHAADECPSGHPFVARRYRFTVLDRLAEVLAVPTRRSMVALAAVIARQPAAMAEAKITCTGTQHTRRVQARTSIGYQGWLLEHSDWIPVEGDALGRDYVPPTRAWWDLPREMKRGVLPRAALPDAIARRLRLVRGSDPGRMEIEFALIDLAKAFPDLAVASDASNSTALWLLRQLNQAPAPDQVVGAPPLPSTRGRNAEWDCRPVIADLPHLDVLDTLAILPPGEWPRISKAYGLAAASDVVNCTALPGRPREQRTFLRSHLRAQLTAFLARGGNVQSYARLVSRLRELPVDSVNVRYRYGPEQAVTPALKHYLDIHRDEGGEVTEARLYLADAARGNLFAVCVGLEGYLGRDRYSLMSLLSSPSDVLAQDGITEEEVTVAAHALRAEAAIEDGDKPDGQVFEGELADIDGIAGDTPSLETLAEPADAHSSLEPGDGTGDIQVAPVPQPATPRTQTPEAGFDRSRETQSGYRDTREIPEMPENPRFRSVPSPMPRAVRPDRGSTGSHWTGNATGGSGVSMVDRDDVERRAIEAAIAFFEQDGVTTGVTDVQRLNKGWDLEVARTDGDLLVEVKGAAGPPSAFVLTRNELDAARSHRGAYRIAYVTGLAAGRRQLTLLGDVAALTDEEMTVLSWSVKSWAELTLGSWGIEDGDAREPVAE